MVRNAKIPTLFAALVATAVCAATPAHAGLVLKLQSDGQSFTRSTDDNAVSTKKSIGNYTTEVNTGTSTPTPSLDLASSDISSSNGGTLIVTLSETGFTSPLGAANWRTQFSGNFLTGSATVTQQTYIDATNTLFGTRTLLGTETASTTPFALSDVTGATTTGPFSLTEVLTIVTTGAAHLSLDASVAYVPEPASLALMASAIIGVGTLRRRKRQA